MVDPAGSTRVLLVDDHAVVRNGLAAILATTTDLKVVGEAADGDEAVVAADRLRPDVVVMDLSMPGTDGVAATAAILARRPETHVLVLTSFGDQRRVLEVLQAGAEGYLLKHSEPERIVAGIREIVRGGSPLDPQAARTLLVARRTGTQAAASSPLTAREEEVLAMVAKGQANKMIARRLGITERTVKAHLTNIFSRIGVADRTQAALWAQRRAAEGGV